MQEMLRLLLDKCGECCACYRGNIALLSEDGRLSDCQIEAVLVELLDRHKSHGDDRV